MALEDLLAQKEKELRGFTDVLNNFQNQVLGPNAYSLNPRTGEVSFSKTGQARAADQIKIKKAELNKFYDPAIKQATVAKTADEQARSNEINQAILKARAIRNGSSSYLPRLKPLLDTPKDRSFLGASQGKTLLGS